MSFKVILAFSIYVVMGWALCYIDQYESYTWYSGIWHGLFFLPNVIKNFIWHTPYKAELCTQSYMVLYRIFSIASIVMCICFRPSSPKKRQQQEQVSVRDSNQMF